MILCEMRESDDKTGIQKVGWYKDGEPLFQYKVGEQISIKYREDMKTGTQDYERFLDNVSDYTTKKYKIVAVVSFPYISDVKSDFHYKGCLYRRVDWGLKNTKYVYKWKRELER